MIDLHTHSRASDGALEPAALVALAAARGVTMLALTDHDCTGGLAEAARSAQTQGLRFIPGVEISVSWHSHTLHVVGLDIDADTPALQQGLARLQALRDSRAREIGRRLAQRGIENTYEGARALAGEAEITRTHFAQHLHTRGHVRSLQEAFRRFLKRGKPGYAPVTWASLEESIGWIHAAGGRAALAHPMRYDLTRTRLTNALADFKQAGGDGLEVVCGRGGRDEIMTSAHLAARFELTGSVGSDFHTPGNPYLQPGGLPPLPETIPPIWEKFRQG
ncbi:MAG TPA: PHP domain-containing protein [Gammaproteobacteria bacterium]|nr:PHP domain-containing protein [Gammaproteobacteria bacterium]